MSPLRIAEVTATFPPYSGGTGTVAWHNAGELGHLGHQVTVFTARLEQPPSAPPGVRVRSLSPLLRVGNAPLLPTLPLVLKPFDVIHLHYPFFFGGEAVWAAASAFGVPYIVTYHNDVELSGRLAPLPKVHHRLMGHRILAAAARVLFTTRDYARSSYAGWLADSPQSMALPNGVDIERFKPVADRCRLRDELGLTTSAVWLLFVGGLDRAHYFKGIPVLLRAMRDVPSPVRLAVVGEGDLRPSYEQQALELGLGDRVKFLGRVGQDTLPGLYAASDMLVLPSVTRGEAFGVVLLEALASGRPAIATALPGVREVAERTGGVRLVPPNDEASLARAITDLADDPKARCALATNGRAAVIRDYGWRAIGANLEAICQQVVERPACR